MTSLLRRLLFEIVRAPSGVDEVELARLLAIGTLLLGAALFIAMFAAAATAPA